MLHNLIRSSVIFLFLSGITAGLQAQEALTAGGGEASGSGGSVSSSVGQLFYTTQAGTDASVAEGVQQPFEISVVSSVRETGAVSITLYPNPAEGLITVKTENIQTDLFYRIYDVNGKLLKSKKASGTLTQFDLSQYKPAVYFLKVTDHEKEVKTFKIIKH